MAWGLTGHRIVGEIADSYLKSKTRREIKKILGTETLAMASNWADFIKSEPKYNYLSSWHYINFNEGFTLLQMQDSLKNDTSINAYTRISFLVKELKSKNLENEKKVIYLRLLVHLVGDIHQPLHTGHEADKGGNDIKLTWFNKPTNLHSVWDSELIESQQLSYTEYTKAINFITPEQRIAWIKGGLSTWLFDSYQVAETIYAGAKTGDKLNYRYNYDNIATVNQQLLKGGVRLADVLNELFAN